MSWCAASLAVVLAASPPGAQRFNLEPVVLGVVGLAGVAVGASRFAVADRLYDQLLSIPLTATSREEAASFLARGRALAFSGKSETALGGVLVAMGGAALVAGVLWFVLEGRTTADWLVSPTATGAAAVLRF